MASDTLNKRRNISELLYMPIKKRSNTTELLYVRIFAGNRAIILPNYFMSEYLPEIRQYTTQKLNLK
jgi:hypothetical protein